MLRLSYVHLKSHSTLIQSSDIK